MKIDPINYFEDFNEEEYEVAELICLKCWQRWIGVINLDIPLKDSICECGGKGTIIKTGQTFEIEEDEQIR